MFPIHSFPANFRPLLSESTPDPPQRIDSSPKLGTLNFETLNCGDAVMRLSCASGKKGDPKKDEGAAIVGQLASCSDVALCGGLEKGIVSLSTPDPPQCVDSPGACSDSPRALVIRRNKKDNRKYVMEELLKMREVKAWELKHLDEEIADADASSSCSTQALTPNTTSLFTPGRPHTESDDEHDGNNYVGKVEVKLFGDE